MKKFGIVLLLLASTSAFAFGGGGSGRTRTFYERHGGVDKIGVHVHENGEQADIDFTCDDPNASPNVQGVCECNEGYEPDESGICVEPQPSPTVVCPPGYTLMEDTCVDENYCPPEKPILAANGTCRACPSGTESLRYSAYSASECSKCGDEYVYSSSTCNIKICPPGYTTYSEGNYCSHCAGGWQHHTCGGCGVMEAQIDACVAACPNRQKMSDGYSPTACTYNCTDFGQVRNGWGGCTTCGVDAGYWDVSPNKGSCNICPGYNYVNVSYIDRCELLSDCPEGKHIGHCCGPDTIYRETGKKSNYKTSEKYSSGVCCPKFRPVWNGSMCVPQE